jgi:hypothetical protein
LKLRIWIDYFYHKEIGHNNYLTNCWEHGMKEYTMKEMTYTVQGEATMQQGCIREPAGGDFNSSTKYGRLQEKNYEWGQMSSKTLRLTYDAWEDDGFSHDCEKNWNDDCHDDRTDCPIGNIQENVTGHADCHGLSHGMTVKWEFNRDSA